jgi:hypothetical protein
MAAPQSKPRTRRRGRIRKLPSGSFQVTVCGGEDPLTGKRIDLNETVPAGVRHLAFHEQTGTLACHDPGPEP